MELEEEAMGLVAEYTEVVLEAMVVITGGGGTTAVVEVTDVHVDGVSFCPSNILVFHMIGRQMRKILCRYT